MTRDFLSTETFTRQGQLATHGDADVFGRSDAVQFQARAGHPFIDCVAEAFVWVDRWPTRAGRAELFEQSESLWMPVHRSFEVDGLYIAREQEVRLVFDAYLPLAPGATYRLHLPTAVVTRGTVRLIARQRAAGHERASGPRFHARPRAAVETSLHSRRSA